MYLKRKILKIFKYYKIFSKNCFVPITVGGGLYNLNQVDKCFNNGADKILLGSNIDKPELITKYQRSMKSIYYLT